MVTGAAGGPSAGSCELDGHFKPRRIEHDADAAA